MRLEDKLNSALHNRGLQISEPRIMPIVPIAPVVEETQPVEPKVFKVDPKTIHFATFDTLKQLVKGANKIQPDEDGIRVGRIKTVGVNETKLPMVRGKFIVDDIQKNGSGYEVHLIENPLR